MIELITKLETRLKAPLPGIDAHLRMAHITRRLYVGAPPDAKQAAVLITLFPKNGAGNIVFIQRNANDRDHHGGQISFPGGKAEPTDGTMLDTALRETEEEVGIARNEVKVLGKLTELYIPVSNFLVHPFLGYLENPVSYSLQAEEVTEVLEIPFAHFQDEAVRKMTDIRINQHLTLKNVPYFDVDGRVLWGATAMMLNELMELAQ